MEHYEDQEYRRGYIAGSEDGATIIAVAMQDQLFKAYRYTKYWSFASFLFGIAVTITFGEKLL